MPGAADATSIDEATLWNLLKPAQADPELFHTIVNTPFEFRVQTTFLFLGIIVLLQVNKKTGLIDRVALSNTELAKRTTDVSYVPFNEIKIPLDYEHNIIAKAIRTGEMQETSDWENLFAPAMTPEQARINQANAGIAYSAVHPLHSRDGGAMIFSHFQYSSEIGGPQHEFMKMYSKLVDKRLDSITD